VNLHQDSVQVREMLKKRHHFNHMERLGHGCVLLNSGELECTHSEVVLRLPLRTSTSPSRQRLQLVSPHRGCVCVAATRVHEWRRCPESGAKLQKRVPGVRACGVLAVSTSYG
jgi:hypothetical protein